MKDTLAIIGNFTATRDLFSYARQDCDIWVFNESMAFPFYERADAVFQMHAPVIWKNPRNRNDANHYLWLANQLGECRSCQGSGDVVREGRREMCKACSGTRTYTPAKREGMTIYMQEAYPEIPGSLRYPVDEIAQKFGTRYFSSSVSYALALGIHLGYSRIEIFGVGLATDTEYRYQRDGFTFWCGIAKGCGVDLVYHGDIFDAPMYGYEGDVVLDYAVFGKRVDELTPVRAAAHGKYEVLKAEITDKLNAFIMTGANYDEVKATGKAQIMAGHEFGMMDGAVQENQRYIKKADAMREAADGEFIFSRQEFEQACQALFAKRAEKVAEANALALQVEAVLANAAQAKNKVRRSKRVGDFTRLYDAYMKATVAVGMYTGAMNENTAFLKTLDAHIKAAGGAKSEQAILDAMQHA